MYAVIRSGGKQYRVTEGDVVRLEKLEVGSGPIEFRDVLLVSTGDQTLIGKPLVEGATVSGTVEGEGLGEKVLVFKYKAKKQYRRNRGHRQAFAKVHIDKINAAAK